MADGETMAAETFVGWLRSIVEQWPTLHAFAVAMEVEDNVVSAWLYRNIIPAPGSEDQFEKVTGRPAVEVLVLLNNARKAQWAERLERRRARKDRRAVAGMLIPTRARSAPRKPGFHRSPARPIRAGGGHLRHRREPSRRVAS